MGVENAQAHWQKVYTSKDEKEVSWFQENPAPSLELIAEAGATPVTAIVDIGGGASRLVDALMEKGFRRITVLDISEAALAVAKTRLSEKAQSVKWVVADVTNGARGLRPLTSGMTGRPSISSPTRATVAPMSRVSPQL